MNNINKAKEGISNKKKIAICALAGALIVSSFGIAAMTSIVDAAETAGTESNQVLLYAEDADLSAIVNKVTDIKGYNDYKKGEYQTVDLNGSSINFNGTGATVNGSDLLINSAGTYVFSGTLNDGAIIVDSAEAENVVLVLENANITCKDGAPIYVKSCGKNVVISLPEGTDNTITDGDSYTYEYITQSVDEESENTNTQPSAAIFSKDDLRLNGTGKLTVNAKYNDGITGKDDVEITEATICINAADDGIVGKDSMLIGSGNIIIVAQGDGIKATNADDVTKGYIAVADGTINITSGNDGIQAETTLLTLGGDFTIKTGEGSEVTKASNIVNKGPGGMQKPTRGEKLETSVNANAQIKTVSTKALKAGVKVLIQDGNFNINSEDDAVHSNDSIAIASGKLDIATGDDGIHADTDLVIYNGDINITKSYEGIESAQISIEGGDIKVVSSDDGINVAGGNDNSGFERANGQRGTDKFTAIEGTNKLYIKGGDITVNADGDGIDVNGLAYMTGGEVIVYGPTNNGNGGLDYDGVFEVTGGTLVVVGSTGMAQAPTSGTTVNTIATAVTNQQGGTEVKLVTSVGNTILAVTPEKAFSHIVITSPEIIKGQTYTIVAGTTALASFTVEDTITNLLDSGMGNQGRKNKLDKNL